MHPLIALFALLLLASTAALPRTAPAQNNRYAGDVTALIDNEMTVWAGRPVVVQAVLKQNEETERMTPSELKSLDAMWRSELRKAHKNLISKALDNPLSDYLRRVMQQSDGLYTEIIVTDKRGLNVAVTGVNDSYWHAKEPIWAETVGKNSLVPYIGPLSFSDNTGLFQIEVSFPLIHEEKIVGLVYAGIDVERFDRRF
jgi:hypothetical protein